MTLTLETPALLFPGIALLLLAYTNRYHFIVTLIRELITRCESEGLCDISIIEQCRLLKKKYFLSDVCNSFWLWVCLSVYFVSSQLHLSLSLLEIFFSYLALSRLYRLFWLHLGKWLYPYMVFHHFLINILAS